MVFGHPQGSWHRFQPGRGTHLGPGWAGLFIGLLLVLLLAGLSIAAPPKRPSRKHLVYFANTPDELNVYRVYGAQGGKTLMIIGGIQGDEPGGFLSADLYADISLAKGDLIVVPRANFYSIILHHRGPDGDMNRQFADPVTARRQKKIVKILKELISESDLLLNLHDGSGFYRPRWEGPMANPRRYGQSLIADTDRYRLADGRVLDLKGMAEKVLARVNARIENPKYHLLFNNHRTASPDSIHKEQRRSATFYALFHCNIPAFGVETSKSLPSLAMKIRHHNLVINAFMEELGIQAENPRSWLDPPELKFLVISVNDDVPVVVTKGGSLRVAPGDKINVLHVEANYERGLTCDVRGVGSVNDLRQPLVINRDTTVVARKDHVKIGSIRIKVGKGEKTYANLRSPRLYFLVNVEGQRRVLAKGETLRLVRGDKLTLVDVLSNLPNQRNLQVNFKGFVPALPGPNPGEDRGHQINTATDLLKRYSRCGDKSAQGVECYQVVATLNQKVVGRMFVEVVPAKLDYVVMRSRGGHNLVFYNGESVPTHPGQRLEIVDLKTNVATRSQLRLVLDGQGRRLRLADRLIDVDAEPLRKLARASSGHVRLVVMREDRAIGHLRLNIGRR